MHSSETITVSKPAPGLYVVATPIGNLGDITLRALDILRGVDSIICEDTRVTGKLLQHFGIAKPMYSYNENNAPKMRPKILRKLRDGLSLALVSDAGTPLISDPGFKLIEEVRASDITIFPVPGACAVTAALSASDMPTSRFLFEGFLPAKNEARRKILEELKNIKATLVFYERATRVQQTLVSLLETLGNRDCVLAKELTKKYENISRYSLEEAINLVSDTENMRGEYVVLVSPPENILPGEDEILAMLKQELQSNRLKEAVANVVEHTGYPRNKVYQMALNIKSEEDDG